MKLIKYAILISVIIYLSFHYSDIVLNFNNLKLDCRRTLTTRYLNTVDSSPISIESLLDSGLSDESICDSVAKHLWTSWDDIIVNFSYVSDNI